MRIPNGSSITTPQAKLLARITFERHPRFHTNQRRTLECLEADGYITPDNAGGWIPTDKGLVAAGYFRGRLTQRRTNHQESVK